MMNMASFRCPTLAWLLLLQSVMIHALCHNETTRNVYMIGFMENEILNAPNSTCKLSLHIVNTGENTTCVYYQTKDTQLSSISIPGRTTQVVPFSEEYMVKGSSRTQRGIRVESGDGVIIYGVNRFNKTGKHSMDGFLSIPVTYADTCFYAVTLSKWSQILLVGIVNGTSVNVTLRTNSKVKFNGRRYTYSDGTVIDTTLDEYETLQLQCNRGCLTGTFINASHPVSVFSGNKRHKLEPVTSSAGHLVEQIPSVNSWGMYFVNIPPADGSYTCKIVAADPATTVNFTCSDNTSESVLLTGTRFHQTNVSLTTICILTADKPILVTLFIGTHRFDPSMVLIPPVHELINGVLYFYVPNSLNFSLVFVTDANVVKIDGKQYNVTAVDNIPGFFKGILRMQSGIHNISLLNHTLRITGYIHGWKNERAMSYPLLQHMQDSCDNVATTATQGQCERCATAGTSTVNLPIDTTSSNLETVTTPPGTSVSVTRTTTSQELTSTYKEVKTETQEMITSSVGMTTVSRAFEKITTSPLQHLTVSSIQTCSCLQYNCSLNPNDEEMKRIIEALRTELLIQPEKTNRYKRSLTSAWDDRTSAKVLGYGASIILGAVGIGIVILDLNNLIVMAKRIRRNLLSKSCHNKNVCI